ncbi:hypothetical protein JCM3765_003251 [Sporobolomyces pararoseus]
MESLGQLNGALPPPSSEDLQKAFRHAALSITTMYQASKKASATAYLAGKKEALQDVLEFLQASLDHPQSNSSSVSRLIDYIWSVNSSYSLLLRSSWFAHALVAYSARQEAIKAEEEDNDDEDNSPPPPQRSASAAPAPPSPHRPGPFQHRASSSSTATLSTNSAPLTRSNSSYQPRHTPAPVASTSSAPASPSFSPASSHSNALHRPNPFPFSNSSNSSSSSTTLPVPVAVSTSPSPLASSTLNLPLSPLGRASPAHHLGHHSRSLRSRTSSRGKSTTPHISSGQATPTTTSIGGLEAAELGAAGGEAALFGLGMKRRWGIPTANEVVDVVAIDDAQDDSRDGDELEGSQSEEGTGGGMEMEMEGWDGVGERPFKRVARNLRRDLGDSDEEREGGGGDGSRGEANR